MFRLLLNPSTGGTVVGTGTVIGTGAGTKRSSTDSIETAILIETANSIVIANFRDEIGNSAADSRAIATGTEAGALTEAVMQISYG